MKSFDQFRLDTVNQCLWRGAECVPLAPKAFDLLRYLVENSPRLVTQEEILEALWPETYVNPEGVRKYILELRKALGDSSEQPSFIQTLPKRGYRFVARISEEGALAKPGAGAREPRANMVGRDAELARLHHHLEQAAGGQRQILFVTGEAGIGKTTLVDAFERQLARRADVRMARGQCIEGFGGKEAYYPILEALGSMLRGPEAAPLIELLAKHAPTWLVQFPAFLDAPRREALQREILGGTRERMVREICEALENMTAVSPLVLILDDLHWVDSSTLDVISAVARRREPAKLLLIGTYRPVDAVLSHTALKNLKKDLQVRRLCEEIVVDLLEEPDVSQYLEREFALNGSAGELAKVIHRNSGGNPLFMRAIIEDIVKRGLIAEEERTWRITAPLEEIYTGIPETLQQMLEAQIEGLAEEERRVLAACSIIGERFSAWAAAGMLDTPETSIEQTCDMLAQRQQFIRLAGIQQAPNGTDSTHYEFRHALYRQALYRTLLSVTRVHLHRSLAERLMPFCNAGRRELAAELALHFEKGLDYDQAARCLLLAAENAAGKFAQRESIRMLQEALALAGKAETGRRPALEVQILRRLGDAYCAAGAMADSLPVYEQAAAKAAGAGLKEEQVGSLVALAFPIYYANPDRGREILEEALQVCAGLDNPLLAAQTQLTAAGYRMLYDSWRKDDEEIWARARETISRLTGSPAIHEVFYAHIPLFQGDYREARESASEMMRTTRNPTEYMLATGAVCAVLMYGGRCGEVLETTRAGIELAAKNAADPWMWSYGEIWLRLLCLDFEGALRLAKAAAGPDLKSGPPWMATFVRLASGYLEIDGGHIETALEYFAQVRDFRVTPKYFIHWHWRLRAELGAAEAWLSAGDLANARREADGFLEHALSTSDPIMHALAWDVQARVAQAANDNAAARSHIEKGLDVLHKYDVAAVAWRVHATAADVYGAAGDDREAELHRVRAREIIMKIADSFDPEEPLRHAFLNAAAVRLALGSQQKSSEGGL